MKNRVIFSLAIILLIAGGTFGLIKWLQSSAPEAKTKDSKVRDLAVKTMIVQQEDVELTLASEGVVQTRRDTILSAQVGGEIVEVDPNFEVGATFKDGDMIARIDPVNYEAAVAQAASALAEARLALVQEAARAEQAERDWEKIGNGREPTDLVLRVPFVESAEARVTAAEAGLKQAEADLARTVIRAPFDCRVRSINLNLGATVMPGAQLGIIFDGDNLLIRLPVSLDDYASLPENPEVDLRTTISGRTYSWTGEMMWELGEVDQQTFSAYILVRVLPNPEAPARFRLPLPGTFLKAGLGGAVLPAVVGVPRAAVRGRDEVFVLSPEDTLEIRKLVIARSTADTVYATSGIEAGAKVIINKIEMPSPGITLVEENRAGDNPQPIAE